MQKVLTSSAGHDNKIDSIGESIPDASRSGNYSSIDQSKKFGNYRLQNSSRAGGDEIDEDIDEDIAEDIDGDEYSSSIRESLVESKTD